MIELGISSKSIKEYDKFVKGSNN